MRKYSNSEIAELVKNLCSIEKEPEWLEFKCNNKDPKLIGEYISALSNSAAMLERPCAYIVWGIEDSSHEIVGTSFNYELMKELNGGKQMKDVWIGALTPFSEKTFGKHPTQKPLYLLHIRRN